MENLYNNVVLVNQNYILKYSDFVWSLICVKIKDFDLDLELQ